MFINNEILGGRVEAAVIEGKKKETLISLQLLKRWDLIHESFPNQTISDDIESRTNKRFQAYSSLYEFHSALHEGSMDVAPPSKACRKLKEELMGKWASCFKEELGKEDRMHVESVILKLKEGYISPWFCSPPYDTLYHLRTMYEKEIKGHWTRGI